MQRCFKQIRHLLPALVLALSMTARAQDNSTSGQTPNQDSGNGTPPPAATGPASESLENPPLSGLDRPKAEPAFGGRSYLVPGAQVSESALSTGSSNGPVESVTRLLGSADLQKLWRKYALGLDYIGTVAGNTGATPPGLSRVYQAQTLASDQRIPWRTGMLAIRDAFSYLPQGSFGFNSYGGVGSVGTSVGTGLEGTGLGGGIAGGTPAGFLGGGQYGGNERHIENLSTVDVVQALSPRSTVTLAGGYDFVKFFHSSGTPSLIDSQQTSAQVGYNRILTRKDQVGVLYAYEQLHFPVHDSGTVEVHVWNALYAHRLTGRLNFMVGAGPEIVDLHTPAINFLLLGIFPVTIPASTQRSLSGSGQLSFEYTLSARTFINLGFMRYVSTGSGFFAGANTDAVRLSASHSFARKWGSLIDGGYSYNSRVQNLVTSSVTSAPRYEYWYVGAAVHRQLGHHFDAFASYQLSTSGIGSCTAGSVCGSHEHIGNLGLNWHPDPIRLD
jgi:hypothetical protein